jgi:hypothetical protein
MNSPADPYWLFSLRGFPSLRLRVKLQLHEISFTQRRQARQGAQRKTPPRCTKKLTAIQLLSLESVVSVPLWLESED